MKKNSVYFLFGLMLFVAGSYCNASTTITYIAAGPSNWNNAANWDLGRVPAAGDFVIIGAGKTCQVDVNTNIIDSIAVYGNLNFTSNNLSDLKYSAQFTIYSTGVVNNTGSIEKTTNNGNFNIQGNGTYIHNPFNNVLLDESIFYNSTEYFSNTSNITIMKWYDISIPLGSPSRVQISNFGNLTLSVNTTGLRWNQKGYFSVNRIRGTFNITDGIIEMDDGQGATTNLTLQNVFITNTGSLIVRNGAAPSFTLTTGAFSDLSTSLSPTVLADTTFCLFTWNAGGNVQLGHAFYGMVGSGTETGGDLRINITGNLTISGTQTCMMVTQCDAPLRLTVTGTTTISGTPTKVRFVDGNNGLLNFSTNNFIISGGSDNILLGGGLPIVPRATGVPSIAIANDFLINGASTNYILNSDTNTNKLRLTVGNDFIMSNTGAQLTVANHKGANTFYTGRDFIITGGKYTGEMDTANVAIDSLIVSRNFSFSSPSATDFCIVNAGKGATVIQTTGNFSVLSSGSATGQGVYGIYNGIGSLNMTVGGNYIQGPAMSQCNLIFNNRTWLTNGSLVFTVAGIFDQNGGFFKGINSQVNSNNSTINFSVNSVDFDGGHFSAYHTANNSNGNANFNVTNNCDVNFAAITDTFMFVGIPFVTPDFCYLTNNVTIGGSLLISGADGAFVSSYGKNGEVVNITGGITISAGNNAFNPAPLSVSSTHNVFLTVGGSVSISGGNTYFSQLNDSLLFNIGGNLTISGGSVTVKGKSGIGIVNVAGGFNMTGGSLFFHNNSTSSTPDGSTITVNSDGNAVGDFSHTGGTITFDNFPTGNPAQPQAFFIYSPNYTIGGTGTMVRNGTSATGYWGAIRFKRAGTTNFNRTSSTHSIQQARQYVDNGTTLDVISGDVQIGSWSTAFALDMLTIQTTGVLALRGSSIRSNGIMASSGITVSGRLRTQHPNGLYNNTANAALDATSGMNYFLQTGSTVEYYGTSNQIITGTNLGLAITPSLHRYYNLDINMGGTAFAYPTNNPTPNSVFVRHYLNLLNGELNLDNDHVPTNGGRSIIILDSTTAAISQVSGFIRSETEDGSGMVRWNIGRATGNHVFPFGYTSAVADRIPFTFSIPSGDADTVSVSTYHTNSLNAPYPPTVLHVRNNSGLDNSSNTVDRFWYIGVTGASNNANMTFRVLNGASSVDETSGISTLRAQRWVDGMNSWEVAYQGVQSNPTANSTLVTGASIFPNWWTLSGNNTPLPVNLLSFSGNCEGAVTSLQWTTSSEINNDHFSVLRSGDGVNFELIGKVSGHGNSTTNISYKFIDENPLNEFSYYKLIQTDYNGLNEEFGPVVVKNCKDLAKLDVVITTHEKGNANLLVYSPYSGNFTVDVFSLDGQLILSSEKFIEEGSNLIPLQMDKISSGIYHVRLHSDLDMISKKVFISKN